MAADERKLADGAYGRFEGLDEEDEQDVQDETDVGGRATSLSDIVVAASTDSLSAQPSVAGNRSRSEVTYEADMAVYTPAGQPSRRRSFFPAGDTSVLVEETMDDGSVRVIVAHDTFSAVQHMQQQAEQQRHTDEAHHTSSANAAQAHHKRDAEQPLDPISSFAAKLLDFNSHSSSSSSSGASKEHDGDGHGHETQHSKPHLTRPHSHKQQHEEKGRSSWTATQHHTHADDDQPSGVRPAHRSKAEQPSSNNGSSFTQQPRPPHTSDTRRSGTRAGTDESSSGESSEEESAEDDEEEEEELPHSNRMTGLPVIVGMPDRH